MTMRDWSGDATKIFKGKVVKRIGYMSQEEAEEWGWGRAPFIEFTDGHWILASADDEGTGCGAFFTSDREMITIPQNGR